MEIEICWLIGWKFRYGVGDVLEVEVQIWSILVQRYLII